MVSTIEYRFLLSLLGKFILPFSCVSQHMVVSLHYLREGYK